MIISVQIFKKLKKLQSHHECFLIIVISCSRRKGLDWHDLVLQIIQNISLKILPFTNSITKISWWNNLWFKRYIQKYIQPRVLMLIMILQYFKLIEWFKISNLNNSRTKYYLLMKKEEPLNCISKTVFSEVVISK